jgi:hypothetical protein
MELVIFLFIYACTSGAFAWFIWKCLGSPQVGQTGEAVNLNGWIFSKLGAWICKKYNAYEIDQLDTEEEFRQLNPYRPFGVCLICFSYWIVLLLTILILFVLKLPMLQTIAIFILMPPLGVLFSKKASE